MAMLKRSIILAAVLLAAPLWAVSTAPARPARAARPAAMAASARTAYDGLWSVLIITDAGSCDRGYRYALHIKGGRIFHDDPSFDISGRVGAGGQVSVVVRYGQQLASGTGRLFRDFGEGRWSGRSASAQCSGHWQAERRG